MNTRPTEHKMELFVAGDYYIIQRSDYGLWCSRLDGSLVAKTASDIAHAWNPICLGKIYGVIGKIKIHPDSDTRLLLISEINKIGTLHNAEINQITKIVCLTLSREEAEGELDIDRCEKHHFSLRRQDKLTSVSNTAGKGFQKTWSSIKAAAETVKPKKQQMKDKEKFVRKVQEELLQLFNDGKCFYYSPDGDITNTVQRKQEAKDMPSNFVWELADDRFFWNKHMLDDLIHAKSSLSAPWIIPVIQGFIQMEPCNMLWDGLGKSLSADSEDMTYKIWLISRRSRHRAGTRYKRRGVDENGHSANYVETEQVLLFHSHTVSLVQVRGSVPIYWSQSGIKYRPPLVLEHDETTNQKAFERHMQDQLLHYKKVALVNLVDQTGKEKILHDEFLKHVVLLNSPDITYITFDFHEYCRGMRFEHISILIDMIADIIKGMKYCWIDSQGMICKQEKVFRSNCVDCLDRTNVFQSAIARVVLETQCQKLGLLAPEEHLPSQVKHLFQQIWANNGDAISRQYAGTAALKGDYTRTGERKLTGLMKDGMNSANRYYKNTFKDIYRQAMIDLMVGTFDPEDLNMVMGKQIVMDEMAILNEKGESVRTLIEECKKLVITEPEICLGAWPLIDADPWTGDPGQTDMDKIILLTQRAYYLVDYDDDIDEITAYQCVYLENVEKIELGLTTSLFRAKQMCLRIYYNHEGESGFFHMLRNSQIRLFNNKITTVTTNEDAKECLWIICHQFQAAWNQVSEETLPVTECKINRRRSKPHPWKSLSSQATLALNKTPDISRNSSAADLKALVPGPETINTVKQSLLTVPKFTKKIFNTVANKSRENLSIFDDLGKSEVETKTSPGESAHSNDDLQLAADIHVCHSLEDLESPTMDIKCEFPVSAVSSGVDHAVLNSCGILTIGSDQVLVKGHRLSQDFEDQFLPCGEKIVLDKGEPYSSAKHTGFENPAFDENYAEGDKDEGHIPKIDVLLENGCNQNESEAPDENCHLKTSFSDGAISYSAQVDQVSVDVPVPSRPTSQMVSSMNKLKAKMQQLPKPAFPTSQSRRQQLQETVKDKWETSDLRFKNCKTRIILL